MTYADTNSFSIEGLDTIKLNFSDGSKYEGQVVECLLNKKKSRCMQGLGIYSTHTGHKYKGYFENHKPDGYGLFSSTDGQSYEGSFKKGELSGKGIMNYSDGRKYEGNFEKNKLEGYGEMTYPSGRIYGEGSRYEGEWKNDKRDGKGRMIYLDDGRELKGWYKNNVFIKKKLYNNTNQ